MPLSSRASPTQSHPWVRYAGAIPSRTAAGHPALSTPLVQAAPHSYWPKFYRAGYATIGRAFRRFLGPLPLPSLVFALSHDSVQSSARDVRSVACCRPTCAPRVRARTASRSTSGPRVVPPRRPAPSCSSCPAAASNRCTRNPPPILLLHC
jgi:hypothetical protein